MSFINPKTKEVICKIAYYGAPFSGKSTTLKTIYKKSAKDRKGELVTLSHEESGALFFDFLPLTLGKVNGFTRHLHVYTIPSQVVYSAARTLILKGLDGIVFVVDSSLDRVEQNLEGWNNLKASLKNHDMDLAHIPLVMQYNKQDSANALPVEDLNRLFNTHSWPEFPSNAVKGDGVMEAFQGIARKVLMSFDRDY